MKATATVLLLNRSENCTHWPIQFWKKSTHLKSKSVFCSNIVNISWAWEVHDDNNSAPNRLNTFSNILSKKEKIILNSHQKYQVSTTIGFKTVNHQFLFKIRFIWKYFNTNVQWMPNNRDEHLNLQKKVGHGQCWYLFEMLPNI